MLALTWQPAAELSQSGVPLQASPKQQNSCLDGVDSLSSNDAGNLTAMTQGLSAHLAMSTARSYTRGAGKAASSLQA